MTQQQVRSTFDEKLKRGMFEPVARWITGLDAEDRLQDGICQTYEMYARYAVEKDKVLDDGILVHSCRLRLVDLGRRKSGRRAAEAGRDAPDELLAGQGRGIPPRRAPR